MAMGADYSFELIFNETCAPQFNAHNNSFLASVAGAVCPIEEGSGSKNLRVSIVSKALKSEGAKGDVPKI